MRRRMQEALLEMYRNLDSAAERQELRGVHDQGERSKVTSGHHLDVVADAIREDLIAEGYNQNEVYYKDGCLRVPGWFRPSKDWDLLAFDDGDLLGIVELKSINSSFGNNANNRSEEVLGSAVDALSAIKYELIPSTTTPPALGYVLVVRMNEKSTSPTRIRETVYPIDQIFENTSYLQRLTILCHRLLAERLYQAVWIVGVDPDSDEIYEPDRDLTYEKFLRTLAVQLDIHRA